MGTLNGFGRGETTRRRALSRALTALLLLVSLFFASTASSAHAYPRGDLIDCGDTDAPIPASPYGDGSFIVRPSTAETELPAGYEQDMLDYATKIDRQLGHHFIPKEIKDDDVSDQA